MSIKYSIFCYLFALLLVSCQKETKVGQTNKITTISHDIDKIVAPYLLVSHIPSGFIDTLRQEDSHSPITLSIKAPQILSLTEGRTIHYIYARPGEAINLVKKERAIVPIEQTKENKYLQEFATIYAATNSLFNTVDLAKLEADSFITTLYSKYKKLEALNRQIVTDEEVDTSFKIALKNRLAAALGNDMLSYNYLYEYHHKKQPNLPDSFFDGLEIIPLDETVLLFKEGIDYGDQLSMNGIDYKDFPSLADFFTHIYDGLPKVFSTPIVQNFFQLKAIENQLLGGSGIDGIADMLADYKTNDLNNYCKQHLAAILTPWANLKEGLPAPDFTGFTKEGKKVLLSDLKGKPIYVDVWATWCGPCVAEIPSLKSLEAELHPRGVEFVSISIDAPSDKQKWIDYIKRENLGGIQLLAEDAWKAEIMSNYNISGIPRFLLIDKEGKIVSANAPRPSSERTKGLIEGAL